MNITTNDSNPCPGTTIQQCVYEQWLWHSAAPCLILGSRTHTYDDVVRSALAFSDFLKLHFDVRAGDRVALVLSPPNIPHFVIAFLGTLFAGGIPVHANIKDWNATLLRTVLEQTQTSVVVTIGTTLPADKRGKRILDLSHVVEAISLKSTGVRGVILVDLRDIVSKDDWKKRAALSALWWKSAHSRHVLRSNIPTTNWHSFLNCNPSANITTHPGRANDDAALLYTSGTSDASGVPKAVPLTHHNILSNINQCAKVVEPHLNDLNPEQRSVVAALPFYHAFGLVPALLYPLTRGFPVILTPKPQDDGALLQSLTKQGGVVYLGTPPFFFRKPVADADGKTFEHLPLRMAISGSQSLNERDARNFEQTFGVLPIQGYGLTETSPVLTLSPVGSRYLSSIGRPLPNTRLVVADPINTDGFFAPAPTSTNGSQEGLLLARGPQVMRGYRSIPKKQQPFVSVRGHEGAWFNTGDIVRRDHRGNFYVVGRLDRQFKCNGEKIIPETLERQLEQHPAIDVAIVGSKDINGQTGIVAGIILHKGKHLDHHRLCAWCQQNNIQEPWETIVLPQETRDDVVHLSGKKLYGAFRGYIQKKEAP